MATCYRHPDRETGVSCADCGRPICPDCMIAAPVGMKCPECARQPRSARVTLKPDRAGRAIAAALIGGIVLGWIVLLIQGSGLFLLTLFLAWGVGVAMGELVLWASGRYRARSTAWIAVGGCVWTFLVPYVLILGVDVGAVADSLTSAPFVVIGILIAGFVAYRRVE